MLYWILSGIAVLVGLVAVVAIVGTMLPRGHIANRSRSLRARPQDVWRAITEVESFPAWRSSVARVQRLPDANGLPSWREFDRRGDGLTLVCESFESPQRLVTRIADKNLPFGGSWTWIISPTASGCELSMTENGEIYNPIFRFMARFVLGYSMTLDRYLADLEKHLTPQP